MDEHHYAKIGECLAALGSLISAIATLVNNIFLLHVLAMQIWFFSNPIMLTWFIGYRFKKWDSSLSLDFMIGLYSFYIITNAIGLFLGK